MSWFPEIISFYNCAPFFLYTNRLLGADDANVAKLDTDDVIVILLFLMASRLCGNYRGMLISTMEIILGVWKKHVWDNSDAARPRAQPVAPVLRARLYISTPQNCEACGNALDTCSIWQRKTASRQRLEWWAGPSSLAAHWRISWDLARETTSNNRTVAY